MFRSLCLPLTSCCLLISSDSLHAEDWRYSLRAGAASVPRYSGSDERVVAPLLGGQRSSALMAFFSRYPKGSGLGV
ncbi:hypothetical protein ACFS4T_15075 [Pseudomonas lini]